MCFFALISAIGFSRERARGGIQCSRFGSVCCCVLKNWSKSNNMCSRFSWELFENYLSVRKFRFKCSSFATYRVLTASSSATFTRARTHWLICDFISHSHSHARHVSDVVTIYSHAPSFILDSNYAMTHYRHREPYDIEREINFNFKSFNHICRAVFGANGKS